MKKSHRNFSLPFISNEWVGQKGEGMREGQVNGMKRCGRFDTVVKLIQCCWWLMFWSVHSPTTIRVSVTLFFLTKSNPRQRTCHFVKYCQFHSVVPPSTPSTLCISLPRNRNTSFVLSPPIWPWSIVPQSIVYHSLSLSLPFFSITENVNLFVSYPFFVVVCFCLLYIQGGVERDVTFH